MRNQWAVVTVVLGALASITTLSALHVPTGDLLNFIGASVVPTVAIMLVGHNVSGKVDEVHKQVNGRMSELIAKTDGKATE